MSDRPPLSPAEEDALFVEAVRVMAEKVWEPADLFAAFVRLTRRHVEASKESSAEQENVQP